jgi:hypothetical protein
VLPDFRENYKFIIPQGVLEIEIDPEIVKTNILDNLFTVGSFVCLLEIEIDPEIEKTNILRNFLKLELSYVCVQEEQDPSGIKDFRGPGH